MGKMIKMIDQKKSHGILRDFALVNIQLRRSERKSMLYNQINESRMWTMCMKKGTNRK